MKEAFWGYFLLALGLFIIVIMIITQNLTSTSEEDYYLAKEVMEAAMTDSIDYGLYRYNGDIRIIESKFVENFTRRFADSINGSKTYTLDFYEIYEYPPKATVRISTSTGTYGISGNVTADFDILTTLSAILESKLTRNESTYNLSITVTNGSVNKSNKIVANDNDAVFTITPYEGYTLENMTVDCGGLETEVNGKTLIVKNVTSNKECFVTLKQK